MPEETVRPGAIRRRLLPDFRCVRLQREAQTLLGHLIGPIGFISRCGKSTDAISSVISFKEGRIVALRACADRAEAFRLVGLA